MRSTIVFTQIGKILTHRHPELDYCHPELTHRHPELDSGSITLT